MRFAEIKYTPYNPWNIFVTYGDKHIYSANKLLEMISPLQVYSGECLWGLSILTPPFYHRDKHIIWYLFLNNSCGRIIHKLYFFFQLLHIIHKIDIISIGSYMSAGHVYILWRICFSLMNYIKYYGCIHTKILFIHK